MEFSQILGAPVEYFFEGLPSYAQDDGGARIVARGLDDFVKSKEGRELLAAFASIRDPRVRRQMLQVIRTLAFDDED